MIETIMNIDYMVKVVISVVVIIAFIASALYFRLKDKDDDYDL